MRVTPADVPRRPLGLRGWLIGAAVVFVLLLFSVRGLARFYTDYLWFQEVGFTDTWRALLRAKAVPALIFSAVFFILLLVNLIVADRIAPRYRATAGPEDEIIERYRTYVAPYAGRLRVVVALFFALVMGGGVSAEWRSWVLFSNSVDFGVDDPQFGRDIGFYVFRLPFLEFAVGWVFAALLVVLIVTAVFHYLNGGIRLQSPWQRVTPQVKVHLSVILALMALTKTAEYYLARYELVFSQRGFVEGAGFTDVKAQLPALNLLMIISIAAAALFIANIFRKGWVFPIIAVGLWAFISLVVGTIYPAVIQRVRVEPNEFAREAPYIERNIEATREAFGIGSVVDEQFEYAEDLELADIEAHAATFDNIRMWDPPRVQEVYEAQEERGTFYRIDDVDVDRYRVGDETLSATVAVRELDEGSVPEGTWTNRHLVYTHGFGLVSSTANLVEEGEPSYLISDIPPTGELAADLEQPGVYFGEGATGYTVVGSNLPEQQASSDDSTEEVRYEGAAGVTTSNFVRRAALALRFADWNLFVSGQIDGDSRVLYKRDVRERVATAAPFLRFDSDPYPVVLDGRVLWLVDAYTLSDRYPYSESLRPSNLPDGSGLNARFNYVRNSVKATVDAYDGTINFYVIDESDPMIQAYQQAFPELFSRESQMPEGLREHWRYPEDLFRAQTEHFTLYHMTDPDDFYSKQNIWDIVPEPGTGPANANTTTGTTAIDPDARDSATLPAGENPIEPYYLTMQLPGASASEFILTRPFTPRGKPNQLSGFMVARNDGENYGKLLLYEVSGSDVPSANEAKTLIESEEAISERLTLLDAGGSTVERGSIQLLPIRNSIVYACPIYVTGQGEGSFPRLRFLAVAYTDRAVLVDFEGETEGDSLDSNPITTVDEALQILVSGAPLPEPEDEPGEEPPPEEEEEPTEPTTPPTTPPAEPGDPGEGATVDELLAAAESEFQAADEALTAGGPSALSTYEEHIARAREFVDRATALLAEGTTTTTTTPVVNASTRR